MTGCVRRAAARVLAPVLLAPVVLAGCATGTDDELQPRATPTVTVTGEPVRELPDRLDLASDLDFSGQVVWAEGTRVHVGERTVDVAPLLPTQLVALDEGLLVLADTQVWFVAGRRAEGLPLPPTTDLALSADGSQVVLRVEDRDEPVAWTTAGARVDDGAVAPVRAPRRTATGPGEYAVVRGDGGAQVVDAAGGVVPVQQLPADLQVRGWTAPDALYGTGRLPGADDVSVVSCALGAAARCTAVGTVAPGTADDLVFGAHPAG